MVRLYGVRELSRLLSVPTPRISYTLYHDFPNEDEIPMIGGRRLVPEALVPRVAERLRARGVSVKGG
ncbi:MAG: hypothetical protein IID41_10725 [Planctomycetes bacterium]|nr:hypothetical protein [Planctomycetota bacterium]